MTSGCSIAGYGNRTPWVVTGAGPWSPFTGRPRPLVCEGRNWGATILKEHGSESLDLNPWENLDPGVFVLDM